MYNDFRAALRLPLILMTLVLLYAPSLSAQSGEPERPKLVLGIVVDQMRWDYLYRFHDRFAPDGGFRRMMGEGFRCEQMYINYIPTITACGHSSLYTGSVPGIHGITGNNWYDTRMGTDVYCTSDPSVQGVGTNGPAGKMSPRNMLVTTIGDELRAATNFRSKVVGVSIKDRGSILPAGHSADAAYWYDGSLGKWVSSTYYMQSLPAWVEKFNALKLPDQYLKEGWKTLFPIETYLQSTTEKDQHAGKKFWPYTPTDNPERRYAALPGMPQGNTFTVEMAMAAVKGEQLGRDNFTDLLAVSFSSPDVIGHTYGTHSIQIEDTYLRLDRDLGRLFRFLDEEVGKGQWIAFLSADHAVAHSTDFAGQRRLPGGGIAYQPWIRSVDSMLIREFGHGELVASAANYQIHLNHRKIDSLGLPKAEIEERILRKLSEHPAVYRVFRIPDVLREPMPERLARMAANGYFPGRSGDIQIMFRSGYMSGGGMGTTHGAWNPYDAHIPLLWYGWKIPKGSTYREVHMTDVAPTLAALLKVQVPSGCIGSVVTELVKE